MGFLTLCSSLFLTGLALAAFLSCSYLGLRRVLLEKGALTGSRQTLVDEAFGLTVVVLNLTFWGINIFFVVLTMLYS